MKSSLIDLQKRGYIQKDDLLPYQNYSYSDLLKLLDSNLPYQRTCAIQLLVTKFSLTEELTSLFLNKLVNEKSLYTKIALCDALATGTVEAVSLMLPYLGKIGSNQYRELPVTPSKKKSFPLPRDIIARTLGNMSPSIISILDQAIQTVNENQLSELLDGYGMLIFYHPELATTQRFQNIKQLILTHDESSLITYKAILCLSAFPLLENEEFLVQIISSVQTLILRKEAERSLKLIQNH